MWQRFSPLPCYVKPEKPKPHPLLNIIKIGEANVSPTPAEGAIVAGVCAGCPRYNWSGGRNSRGGPANKDHRRRLSHDGGDGDCRGTQVTALWMGYQQRDARSSKRYCFHKENQDKVTLYKNLKSSYWFQRKPLYLTASSETNHPSEIKLLIISFTYTVYLVLKCYKNVNIINNKHKKTIYIAIE